MDGMPKPYAAGGMKLLKWVVIALLAAMLMWVIFRAHLGPELLIGFANGLTC